MTEIVCESEPIFGDSLKSFEELSTVAERNITLVTLDLFLSSGGPRKTIHSFREALNAEIYSFVDPKRCGSEPLAVSGARPVPAMRFPLFRHFRVPTSSASREIRQQIERSNLVSCHSFYRYHNYLVNRVASRMGTPYWFVPHGILDPWVLSYGHFQKEMFWKTIGEKFLAEASTVIFATHAERDKALMQFKLPGAEVIPWPVGLVSLERREEARMRIRRQFRIGTEDRVLLMFGRLHHMKRPLETIRSVARCNAGRVHVLIVGNEETVSYWDCLRVANDFKIKDLVHVVGSVYGVEKYDYMHASDAYISLSHRENFNHTAAESLAAGLPVILSPGNDLQRELEGHECGWFLKTDLEGEIITAIESFAKSSRENLDLLGANGREWVRSELSFGGFKEKLLKVASRVGRSR